MKNTKYILSILLILFVFSACKKEYVSTKFPLASEQNIDVERLEEAYTAAENINGIKSLLVSRNGVLVSEQYFTEMDVTDLYDVRSVTKSVVSALIGIAINEGFIENTNQTLSDFISPLGYTLEGDKSLITIEDLLTMSSGIEWEELLNVSQYNDWVTAEDQIEYVISKPLIYNPGEYFTYNSGGAHLLSVILTEATNMSTHDFALEYFFEPLGMDIEDFGWGEFQQGYFNGGADLTLKPRDMIKIGQLYLNDGNYGGTQIVPSSWVEDSKSIQISTNNSINFGPQYGYLWWINHDLTSNLYFANGYGGQFIVNVPDLNLVIVATSEFQGLGNTAGQQWYNVLSLIINDVLECVE